MFKLFGVKLRKRVAVSQLARQALFMSDGFVIVDAEVDESLAAEVRAIEEVHARQRRVTDSRSCNTPKAKAAPKATGRSSRAPRAVTGPHPVAATSTGRRYYLILTSEPPCIAAGPGLAVELNGGDWVGAGRIPEGFATIADALNAADEKGFKNIIVRWE